jgi:hypothetical protein
MYSSYFLTCSEKINSYKLQQEYLQTGWGNQSLPACCRSAAVNAAKQRGPHTIAKGLKEAMLVE